MWTPFKVRFISNRSMYRWRLYILVYNLETRLFIVVYLITLWFSVWFRRKSEAPLSMYVGEFLKPILFAWFAKSPTIIQFFGTFEHSEKWYSGITQSVQRFQIIYVFTNAECKISLVANDIYNFRMCKWKQLNVLMTLCTIIICIFVSVIYRHTCTLYTSNRKRTSAFSATVAMSNYVATLIRVLLPCYLAQLFAIQNRIKYSKL